MGLVASQLAADAATALERPDARPGDRLVTAEDEIAALHRLPVHHPVRSELAARCGTGRGYRLIGR
jgi:hypothetical protein